MVLPKAKTCIAGNER